MSTESNPATGDGTPVRVTLELLRGSDPIAGSVLLAGGGMQPFAGWIDLVAVVQEAIAGGPEEGRRPAREEQP